jgi:hypothetical protein
LSRSSFASCATCVQRWKSGKCVCEEPHSCRLVPAMPLSFSATTAMPALSLQRLCRMKPACVTPVEHSSGASSVQSSAIFLARIRRLTQGSNVRVHALVDGTAASGCCWLACVGGKKIPSLALCSVICQSGAALIEEQSSACCTHVVKWPMFHATRGRANPVFCLRWPYHLGSAAL